MRNQGGTPDQHIRFLFQFYDYDYSNGLEKGEIMLACRRKMNLSITDEQAKQIVDYYDRKHNGQINYDKFLEDVCADVQPALSFTELTPRRIEAAKKSLRANPFIPKPFAAPPNRVLEKFKKDVKAALVNKVNKLGGSVASWIREAFVTWDREYTEKISDWRQLQGAAKRLGVNIEEEDAKTIMKCYDRFNTGEMHYNYLTKEIMEEDPHFLMNAKIVDLSATATSRTPPTVQRLLSKLKKVLDGFVRKSKGKLDGRDVLHGTFVRFDEQKQGRVSVETFQRVLEELKVSYDETTTAAACKWFDSNGSRLLDYNSLTKQLYGNDVCTERLMLPTVNEGHAYANFMNSRSRTLPSLSLTPPANFLTSTVPHTGVGSLMTQSHTVSSNPFITSMTSQNMMRGSEFGVKSSVMERNLETVESQSIKNARLKMKRSKILAEKLKVERKLAAVEEQRRKLIEEYKAKHGNKSSLHLNEGEKPETRDTP
jgi:Ca2+-binding EF-hand superfamily protein